MTAEIAYAGRCMGRDKANKSLGYSFHDIDAVSVNITRRLSPCYMMTDIDLGMIIMILGPSHTPYTLGLMPHLTWPCTPTIHLRTMVKN